MGPYNLAFVIKKFLQKNLKCYSHVLRRFCGFFYVYTLYCSAAVVLTFMLNCHVVQMGFYQSYNALSFLQTFSIFSLLLFLYIYMYVDINHFQSAFCDNISV